MSARRLALLPVLLFACLGAGLLPEARAEDALRAARLDFVRTRDTCALTVALTSQGVKADARAPTDLLLAGLTCNQSFSLPAMGGEGYEALPTFIVALKGMDLDLAADAAARIGDETAGGLGRWGEALVLARRGRDGEATALLLAPIPGESLDVVDVLFPLTLFGKALAEDDRLLLAAIAREALLEACRRGLLERVVPIARRAAALESTVIGPECVCLAARALRRSGRVDEAGALLGGPESAETPRVHACLQVERALAAWRAGDCDAARTIAGSFGAVTGRAAFFVEALQRARAPLRPVPVSKPLHVSADERNVAMLAHFATLLGRETTPAAVEAAALDQGRDPADAGFAGTFLESLGFRVSVTAGSARSAETALGQGLPVLLYRIGLRGEEFVEEPVVVRARDTSTGLWATDPLDLDEVDALAPDVPRKARILVAVPASRRQDPGTWASVSEKHLGTVLTEAVDLADRGDVQGGVGMLEAQVPSLGSEAVFQLYLGFLYHRRVLAQQDPTLLQLAKDAVERSLARRPSLAFEHFVRGWALLVFHESEDAALRAFDLAQEEEPTSVFLARERFLRYRHAGRAPEARRAAEMAHYLDPRDPVAHFYRASLRKTEGDTAGARQDLRRAFDRRPGRSDVALALVDLEIQSGNPRAALRVIDEYGAHVPEAREDPIFRDRRQHAEMRLVQSASTVVSLVPFLESPLADTRRRVGYQLAKIESDEAERVLRTLLLDSHRAVRVTALRIYVRPWLRTRVEADDELFAAVLKLFRDDDQELVRGAGAGLLSLVRREAATQALVAALVGDQRDPSPYVRSQAADALDERHHDCALARRVLVDALDDEDVTVRRAAIQALFRFARTYHGYDPEGTPAERAAAIARWRKWLEVR